jgi:hypothetical protein
LPQKRTGEPCGRLMTGRGTYNDEFIVWWSLCRPPHVCNTFCKKDARAQLHKHLCRAREHVIHPNVFKKPIPFSDGQHPYLLSPTATRAHDGGLWRQIRSLRDQRVQSVGGRRWHAQLVTLFLSRM